MRTMRLCGAWILLLCPVVSMADPRPESVEAVPRPTDLSLEPTELETFESDRPDLDPGGTRVCGTVVYDNSAGNVSNQFYAIPATGRAADDCYLISSERTICEIVSTVRNSNTTGSAATVELELWSACPGAGGVMLASSGPRSVPINANTTLTWTLATPVTISTYPAWVAWRNVSGTANVGPLVTRNADIGFTADLFYTTSCGGTPACNCWFSSNPYAGFSVRIEATTPVPCTVACPPGGFAEGEVGPCDPNAVDNYNGGCNSTPNVFLDVPCGVTMCGTVSTYPSGTSTRRDTDWYRVTLTQPSVLSFTVRGQTPMQAFIFQPGTGGSCTTGRVTLASGVADACQDLSLVTTSCLPVGQYWLFVGSALFATVPCNTPYVARLECWPCDTCNLTCQAGAVPEGEPICGANYTDNYNTGCNAVVPMFQPLAPGQVICGQSGNYLVGTGNSRDTDWYIVNVPQPSNLTASLIADFPAQIYLAAVGTPNPCPETGLGFTFGAACRPFTLTESCVPAGQYLVVITPVVFAGIPCGRNYVLQTTLTPCNPPPTVGLFSAAIDASNTLVAGDLNNGWSDPEFGGPWFQYPAQWWNEWWPNEYDLTRQKLIRIFIDTYTWNDGFVEIAANWSVPPWTNPQRPPLPQEDSAVVRQSFGTFSTDGSYVFEVLIPYCPAWVSIDIRGARAAVQGRIEHVCLPGAPTGACCFADSSCQVLTQADCSSQGGVNWLGAGTDCFPNPCVPPLDYWLELNGGVPGEQGGTGYEGTWFPYPNAWWNQWWPNEYDLTRQKVVHIRFWLEYTGAPPVIAFNYSAPTWVNPNQPPLAAQDDQVIRIPIDPPAVQSGFFDRVVTLPYCPAWVSVDVQAGPNTNLRIQGNIEHFCLPGAAGACCFTSGACQVLTQAACLNQGGASWLGAGTDCFPNPCVPPLDYWLDLQANVPVEQGGTGWNGTWYPYPNFWWNQWWPNEYSLLRQKRVQLRFWIDFVGPPPIVAFNYSVPTWANPNQPPLGMQDEAVIRVPVQPPVDSPGIYVREVILPICPAWVSVDVRAITPSQNLQIQGYIVHECLPPVICLGDSDCDGDVDFFDIDPFVAKLGCPGIDPVGCAAPCPWQNSDCDQDGDVDFFDIDPFVARLGQPCP